MSWKWPHVVAQSGDMVTVRLRCAICHEVREIDVHEDGFKACCVPGERGDLSKLVGWQNEMLTCSIGPCCVETPPGCP